MKMMIADTEVKAAWENNPSVRVLEEMCKDKPLTIQMSRYGGFEQVGSIGKSLPRKVKCYNKVVTKVANKIY